MAKTSAWVFGIIFIIAGIWGFWPPAIGFLAADWLSSIVHIVVGIILLALAAKPTAPNALKTIGIIYVVFAILGFVQGSTVLFGVFATDQVANWFYLIVGIVIAALGFSSSKAAAAAPQM